MLFDSMILEVGIGLVFVFLLLSLVCTAAGEFISRGLAMRSGNLEKGIRNLLNDNEGEDGAASKFYEHPVITALSRRGKIDKILGRTAKPSYIPARLFAMVLIDLIAPENNKPKTVEELKKTITDTNVLDSCAKKRLIVIVDDSNGCIETARKNIEEWFNESMDRVTGWYARNVQTVILVLALLISVGANVDTFAIVNDLATDPALRTSIVGTATDITNNSAPSGTEALQQLQVFPVGWSEFPAGPQAWLSKIFGLLITTFAISLGAPFWFDLLKNVVNIRGAGKPPK